MGYHPFTDDGHFCPSCHSGPFICTMEDGSCDNDGTCDACLTGAYMEAELAPRPEWLYY